MFFFRTIYILCTFGNLIQLFFNYSFNTANTRTAAFFFDNFETYTPDYKIGATNLTKIDNVTVSFALRNISSTSASSLDIMQANTSNATPPMTLVSNNNSPTYFVVGFCT